MNIAVRYFTRTGNTKKLADAIAEAAGVKAADLSAPLTERADILFLGSSVYAAGMDESVKTFIKNNSANIGVIAAFSSAAILSSTYKQVKKAAEDESVKIADDEFHCRGSFAMMHRGRPNESDLKDAAEFAKRIIKKYQENE